MYISVATLFATISLLWHVGWACETWCPNAWFQLPELAHGSAQLRTRNGTARTWRRLYTSLHTARAVFRILWKPCKVLDQASFFSYSITVISLTFPNLSNQIMKSLQCREVAGRYVSSSVRPPSGA